MSAAQASMLASQVQASAEALRTQVEAARIATETRLASSLAPITKSIEDLRAAQYAQQGEKLAKTDTRSGSAVYLQLISVLIAVGSLVLVIVIALGKSKG
jgi:hypothetical protein